MTRPPAFQFYPRDWLSSQAVSLMTPEQRGGYIQLMAHAWLADPIGVLPDDDAKLASLSGLGDRWPECREAIARAFVLGPGTWTQARMLDERRAQESRQRRATRLGKVGAKARWHKDMNAAGISTAMPGDGPASASALKDLPHNASPSALGVTEHSSPTPPPARAPARGNVAECAAAALKGVRAPLSVNPENGTTDTDHASTPPYSLPANADLASRRMAEAQRQKEELAKAIKEGRFK